MTVKQRYKAFISYSHADKKWGDWLHKKLETFRFPNAMVKQCGMDGNTLHPIFRDREELPGSADLGAELNDYLAHSDALLVICSPRSAKSKWVDQEVVNFQHLSHGKPIVALLIDGQSNDELVRDSFNLPPEILKLKNTQSELIRFVDATNSGRTITTLLNVIHQLKSIALDDLQRLHKRKRATRWSLSTLLLAGLTVVSWFVWQNIGIQKQAELLAESNRLALEAEQFLEQNDHTDAIKLLLQALPTNIESPERPLSEKAIAALRRAMSKPVHKIERLTLAQKVLSVLDTKNANQKLLLDDTSNLRLVDLKTGDTKWQANFGVIQLWGLNKSNNLVLRTTTGLQTVSLSSGQSLCELPLDTHPSEHQLGSLPWINGDHISEWVYLDPSADFKSVTRFDVIDTQTCSLKFSIPTPFTSYVYLLGVHSQTAFSFALSMYDTNAKVSYIRLIEWDTEAEPNLQWNADISGTLKSSFAGYLNSQFTYNGPLIYPDATSSNLYWANETEAGQHKFHAFDMAAKTTTFSVDLPGRPAYIQQDINNPNIMYVGALSNGKNKEHHMVIDAQQEAIVARIEKPEQYGAFQGAFPLSPDHQHWFANMPSSGYQITNVTSGISYDVQEDPNVAITAGSGWLDERVAYAVEQSGIAASFHLTAQDTATAILKDQWITFYEKVSNDKHLLLVNNQQLLWYEPKTQKTSAIMKYDWDNDKEMLGVFSKRYLIVKIRQNEGFRFDVIDLQDKTRSYEVFQNSTAYHHHAFDTHLIVETDFQQFEVYHYERSEPILSVNGKTHLTPTSIGNTYVAIEHNSLTNELIFETLDLDGNATGTKKASAEMGFMSDYIETPNPNQLLIRNSSYVDGVLISNFKILDKATGLLNDIGDFTTTAFAGFGSPKINFYGDIVHFGADFILGGMRSDFVLDLSQKQGMSFDTESGERLLYLSDDLLSHRQVIVEKEKQLFLKHLDTKEYTAVTCEIEWQTSFYGQFSYAVSTDQLIVANAQDGGSQVCIYDRTDKALVKTTNIPMSKRDRDSISGAQASYIEQSGDEQWLMTDSGIRVSLSKQESWQSLVQKAKNLGIVAMQESQSEK